MTMKYWNMNDEELSTLHFEAVKRGNMNAAREVREFQELYKKRVRVIKGRKVPIGTEGVVFFVKRKNYSQYADPWGFNSKTTVGIELETGEKVYSYYDNLEVI